MEGEDSQCDQNLKIKIYKLYYSVVIQQVVIEFVSMIYFEWKDKNKGNQIQYYQLSTILLIIVYTIHKTHNA